MNTLMDRAFHEAVFLLEQANGDLDLLPDAVAAFLLVYSAQGVIDRGGYRYFFEADWLKNPPYSKFVNAYIAIGCEKQAKDLARVVATFPFDDPHLHVESRQEYVAENYNEDTRKVETWGDSLCGDKEVWVKLEKFYTTHASDFAISKG